MAVVVACCTAFLWAGSAAANEKRAVRAGKILRVEVAPSDMALVPAGAFEMGYSASVVENRDALRECKEELGTLDPQYCPEDPSRPFYLFANATPARTVVLHAFEMDRREVTVAQYRRCVAAGGCDVAPLLAGDTRFLEDAWPIVGVTWQDAFDFCQWIGKRLPTEAEWEKSARGTDGRRWPWGSQQRSDGSNHGRVEDPALTHTHSYVLWGRRHRVEREFAPDPSDGAEYAAPPGSLIWGESPYGVMDMAGNVSEWVQDYYWEGDPASSNPEAGGYSDLPVISPVRLAARDRVFDRVVRGGSWLTPQIFTRTYARGAAAANSRSPLRGFRCARDA
jgi:formylglycine-generating enzyme required for sulfatase activity